MAVGEGGDQLLGRVEVGEIEEDPAVPGVVQREHGDDRPSLQDRQRGHGLRSDRR